MHATAWFVLLAAVLVTVAAATGFAGTAVVLPLAAALVLVAVAVHRPRGATWWWAAAGSFLWMIEEGYWAAVRVFGAPQAFLVTDALYTLGLVAWLVALVRLPHKRTPRWTLAALPPLVLLGVLLSSDPTETLSLSFPLTDLALLLAALPALEGTLRGRASDGRLLWVLGFFIRALAAANHVWLSGAGATDAPFHLLWVLAHLLIGLGVWVEVRDENTGPWPAAAMLIGLEAVLFVTTAGLFGRGAAPGAELLTIVALAYVQILAVLVVVVAERRRRLKAEDDLHAWQGLVRRLGASSATSARLDRPLHGLWDEAQRLLPGLRGLTVHDAAAPALGEAGEYAFPIVVDGAEIARLHFERQPDGSDLLDALAPLLGQQIQQLQDQALWREHATTDPLTGLRNRRGLDLDLPGLLARAHATTASTEGCLAVAMLDLDHFKRVNDLHGHPVGDRVLVLLADLLREHTREDDLLVRWGGEEFLLIMTPGDEEAAASVLSRLRRSLRERTPAPLTHPLTFSAGLAVGTTPADVKDVYDRIVAADNALLRAKREGRDRVRLPPTGAGEGAGEA